jgi:hypothetical protein
MAVLDAVRDKCLDCCVGQVSEVRKCTAVVCPNWPFRMGWNPWRDRKPMSPERRREIGERLAAARQSKGMPRSGISE